MATKLYEKDIDKYVDWGGDESTNGLPVSGEYIQKFIKESLNSKFGFMYYDKDAEGTDTKTNTIIANHNPSNQYLIFADKENFALWAENPDAGTGYIIAQFDAPAPATINVSETGAFSKTILLSDKDNQEISFKYVVKDKSDSPQAGQSTINISITNNVSGTRTLPTVRIDIPEDPAAGVAYTFDEIGKYLNEGVNTINFTITSLMFNVSTTVTYQYRVLNLNLSSTFGNAQSEFNMYQGISLEENTFNIGITATGAGNKMLRVFIDSEQIDVIDNRDNKYTKDLFIGVNNPSQYEVTIPFVNANGIAYSWATPGKHNVQMYFYIQDSTENIIKSQTLYYDFVLTRPGMSHGSYILFNRTYENNAFANVVGEGQDPSILPAGSSVKIESEQYLSFNTEFVVLDTSGRGNTPDGSAIIVDVKLFDKTDLVHPENGEDGQTIYIPSGTGTNYEYTTPNYGEKELHIINTALDGEIVVIDVNIKKSSVQIEKTTTSLELELSALNRSNSEGEEGRATWKYETTKGMTQVTYKAEFDKVLWNSQNGWINNCLVLNNGATVTVPMNIFSFYRTGVTFEIDFETENVQDDGALIMQYGDPNGASISIKACEASLQSNGGMNIHTNYKDGARQKIQFIFSYNGNDQTQISGLDCPYLMYIVVNGILDRVAQFTTNDSCIGSGEDYTQFTIGNIEGKVTTKIHNIRVYSRALTLDECVNNFIADSDDVRGNYLRNDIYNEGTKTINVNKILSSDLHIPVMTIYGNITDSIVQVFNKKANVPVDILYQDPMFPQFNYFARDAWMSNQGTSSMNYPRRNFRPYFNKESDANTLRGFASADRYKYETRVWWGLTDADTIARIQSGEQDPDEPFTINGIEYKPLRNKKTLKNKPQTINYDTAIMFVHSGIKIYSDSSCEKAVQIKKLNQYVKDNPDGQIWVQGAYARYKTKDLFTDRWTLKCDYAESSMTHNAGVGRLWGDVMRDVEIGTEGFTYDIDGEKFYTSKPGATNAQRAMQEYNATHADKTIKINGETQPLTFGDIRTSCDGYPIIIINRPRVKKNNGSGYEETYGDPVFLGLYNIMTDKGSTPLFGFEDLKDEDGNTIFNAGNDDQRTECWECLQNGSRLAQMNDATTDDVDGATVDYTPGEANNEDRPIFKTYEARWPDNDDLNDTRTDHLETVIRFVNFCKDAVNVRVGIAPNDKDGYELSDFTKLDDLTAQEWFEDKSILNSLPNKTLYLSIPAMSPKDKTVNFYAKDSDGAIIYDENTGKPRLMDMEDAKANLYKKGNLIVYYRQTYASQVTATSTGSMEALYSENETNQDLMIQRIYEILNSGTPYVYIVEESDDPNEISYEPMDWYPNATDEIRQWYYIDKTFDRTVITKTINTTTMKDEVYTGRVFTYDGKRMNSEREQIHPNAWVTVYLTKNGNNYTYVDEMGHTVPYASGEEVVTVTGSGEKVSKGTSFKGKTKFEYFQDQKYEHFDVWKLACYYVYLMRFAAVDQVIKNTMMTTEDAKHYYFINYDNDTTLGVRNDGYLAYDWQITRETYDESIGSYAYAGFGSVLWNTLEQDQDFLNKVQIAATAMVTSNVLTYDIALDMFNNKQSGTWSERLYNQSEMYKYIGTYNDLDNIGKSTYNPYQNTKYLPFLQGSRASHRDWWLRHRFDLYDSKWSAGEYATNRLDFYMGLEASPSNKQPFLRIVAGSKFYYSIISNNNILGNNFVELEAGQEHTFETVDTLILGNPMQMYGVYKAKILDFSVNRNALGQVLTCSWAAEKGSLIEELILGGDKPTSEIPGCAVQGISQIDRLKTLKVLDIRTCSLMKSLDISQLGNLTKFLADGSSINSFIPAKGVMLEEVSLPTTISTLKLNNISLEELRFTPSVTLTRVEIENVEGEEFNGSKFVEVNGVNKEYRGYKLFDFILKWYLTLKKNHANLANYSCALSFNYIDLEQFYGPYGAPLAENVDDWIASVPDNLNLNMATKKIKSLDLLNAIKKGFGLNNSGVENFVINKGVIKLCGDSETLGLTKENYDELISLQFNDTKKLWDESTLRSDSPFHFDSESSIFVTVTPLGNKEPVYDEDTNTYTIIAGQQIKITATIFPIDNSRQISIVPASKNSVGINTVWPMANGVYTYAFEQGPKPTYLSNDNGTAILDTFEYTDTSAKSITINIFDSLVTINNGKVADLTVNIENMVRPTNQNVLFTSLEGSPILTTQEIDEIRDYKYLLTFDTNNEINVDISGVDASFASNSIISNNEFGQLNVDWSDEYNTYVLNYLPNIQNDDVTVNLYVFIHLIDKQNTTLNAAVTTILKTKKITDIQLTYNNEVLVEDEEHKLTIEHYVQNETEIKTENSRKIVRYSYNVNINPNNYNVPVKSMDIVTPTGIFVSYDIIPKYSLIKPTIIESIDIELPVAKQSMYQFGEFDIVITDIYDNVVSKKVNVILGYFLPDGISLIKTVNNNNIIEFDASDHSENTTVLNQADPTILYRFHIYSKVDNVKYVWGNIDDIKNKYNDTSIQFLSNEQYPNITYSTLNNGSFTVIENIPNLKDYLKNNTYNIDNDNLGFNFSLIETVDEYGSKPLISASNNLKYSVSFNNVTASLDKDIHIERKAALATNFNIYSNDIHAFGESGYAAEDCLYFLDKNLNLYNLSGYLKQSSVNVDVRNYFIALVYVYLDEHGKREYTSLDPWKLLDDDLYIWWNQQSSWVIIDNDPQHITTNPEGRRFGTQTGFFELLGIGTDYTQSAYNNYSEGYLFKMWSIYYKIVCSGTQNPIDGGLFTLESTGSYAIPTNGDANETRITKLCRAYREGDITFTRNSGFNNSNMIFYHIDDYKNVINNQTNTEIVCKPLSSQDYINIMNNYDLFVTYLNALDPNNQYNFGQRLFNKTEPDGYIGNSADNPNYNTNIDGNPQETYYPWDRVTTQLDASELNTSKLHWYFQRVFQNSMNSGSINMPNIQIGCDLNPSNPGTILVKVNDQIDADVNGNMKVRPDFASYCLFGPYLANIYV